MKLKKLDQCSEASYIKYCHAFEEAQEMPFSNNLMNLDYKTWITTSKNMESAEMLPSGYVPSHVFFLVDEKDQLLGNISIRTDLNESLRHCGGNIGYVISPEFRGKQYGQLQLALALKEAQKLGMKEVLLTCDKSNIASSKTIIRNGGRLDSEDCVDGVEIERYWINL